MTIQLLRNTRLFVHTGNGVTFTADNTKEILIQDDFSFSQGSTSSDVTLSEAGATPARGSARFNEALDPVEWNFSTYLRPYVDDMGTTGDTADDVIKSPDYLLWHSLASGTPFTGTGTRGNGVKFEADEMTVGFKDNQHHELAKLTLFYLVDNLWYKIEEVQVGQVELSIDIEGIGMAGWSGQGTQIVPLASQPFTPDTYKFPDSVFATAPYIKNKLTSLRVKDNSDSKEYNIPVTGGTITLNNNITYLTPNTLSRLDVPIGSFTGTFEVSGSLSAYLRSKDGGAKDASSELLNKMLADRSIKNSFEIAIVLGGEYSSAAPSVVVVLPTAHLGVPSVETEDVLTTNIEFKGIPSALDQSDEVYIGMSPVYTTALITTLLSSGV